MTRNEIITELKRYFSVNELVCEHTFAKYGEKSWQFLDTEYLHVLLIVRRDILRAAMTCNTGTLHQRGLRCNRCELVRTKTSLYISSHILGKAGDFIVSGMTAEQARSAIKAKAALLPCNVRIEDGVNWLHIDVLPQYGVTAKVYAFRA